MLLPKPLKYCLENLRKKILLRIGPDLISNNRIFPWVQASRETFLHPVLPINARVFGGCMGIRDSSHKSNTWEIVPNWR